MSLFHIPLQYREWRSQRKTVKDTTDFEKKCPPYLIVEYIRRKFFNTNLNTPSHTYDYITV